MENDGSNDPYTAVLADLRAKRAQIDDAIRTIEALHSGPLIRGGAVVPSLLSEATSQHAPKTKDDGHSPYLGLTIPDAAKAVLVSRRRQMQTADITSAIEAGGVILTSADKINTVGSVLLRRFYTVGDIVRVARGVWGLQEWYPGRRFPGAKSKSEDKGGPENQSDGDLELESLSENEGDTQSNNESVLKPDKDGNWDM